MKKILFGLLIILIFLPSTGWSQTDQDGDGITDDQDLCREIPSRTTNGCPDLRERIGIPGFFLRPPTCNSCPCARLDYAADIHPGDILFTTISSTSTPSLIFSKSNFYFFQK